jgi:predicted DCC family thiol-disulfide oxidoreductase YuxK
MADHTEMDQLLSQHHRIIFFDGACNLCQRSVQFILTHDKKGIFSFASLQSSIAEKTLMPYGISTAEMNTFILLENNKIYTRSTAALQVIKKLGGLWPLLYLFIIVPPFIRDAVYNWIARNRYRWFGKQESCWMPREQWKSRFLS